MISVTWRATCYKCLLLQNSFVSYTNLMNRGGVHFPKNVPNTRVNMNW